MNAIRVLIAEDQAIVRRSLAVVLGLAPDIEVIATAENGSEAVELARSLAPDVILMDVHMPVMNGVEAAAAIKSELPGIKLLMLTSLHDSRYAAAALSAGAEGYVLKGIDPLDLAAAVRLLHRGETLITREIAGELFSRSSLAHAAGQSAYGLTNREAQVLMLVAEGLSNRSIAERLYLSEGTVKNAISVVYAKLNVRNRAAAMKKAADERLL